MERDLPNSKIFLSRGAASVCSMFLMGLFLAGCNQSPAGSGTPTRGMSLQQISKMPANQQRNQSDLIPVEYSIPATPRVDTGQTDALGRPITVSCASCHSNFSDRTPVTQAEQLESFHVGLKFTHGAENNPLTCLTCHHSDNYNYLQLADGRPLEYQNSRVLCAQCHAAQDRDYEHGVHGGMTGFWDRSQGAQVRKTCIDCHDPHSPQFPHMQPSFKPLDRFLEKPHPSDSH